MKFTITDIHVKLEAAFIRSGEPKKKHDKLYIWTTGETIMENLVNRRNRPYEDYKREVIPQLMERLKEERPMVYEFLKDVKWGWNQNCGCSMCPCSPGFVGNVNRGYGNVYSIHVNVTVTN